MEDRNELPALMEPLLLGDRHRGKLTDLAVDLAQKSTAFRSSLPGSIATPIAGLVRAMNCYYSNLIEGHNTHPVDIEKALRHEYSNDARKRDLQQEATAHIAVQEWIDGGGLPDRRALSLEGILEIHRRFCELLPEDLLWLEEPITGEPVRVMPGQLRGRDVKVGEHIAISAGALPRFLARYEEVFRRTGKSESILSAAAAHHRLLWIHPFLDGNGRVARLVSHAVLLEVLDTGALWSVARGLARNVKRYRSHLANCDNTRRNDLDGRGALSEEALAAFTEFFLSTCIDQVSFMQSLIQPNQLRTRILRWAGDEIASGALPQSSGTILETVLYRGELPRGEVNAITGTGDRQARRIVSCLIERGVLTSDNPRSSLRLVFPAYLEGRWMPGLFPDEPSTMT